MTAPSDVIHGRPSTFRNGCRCAPCRHVWSRKNKSWTARAYANGGRTTVPAEDILPALRELTTKVSQRAVDDAIGAKSGYTSRVMRGAIKAVAIKRANAILATAAKLSPADVGKAYVDVTPSTRRLRALTAIGYSNYRLATELGLSRNTILRIIGGTVPQIHGDTHALIAKHYERLSMRLPKPLNQQEAAGITRAIARAAERGWQPPLAFNNIDDLTEKPRGARIESNRRKTDIDPVIVDRLLAGQPVTHSTVAEKNEAMRRWIATGRSKKSLCDLHNWKDNRYGKDAA